MLIFVNGDGVINLTIRVDTRDDRNKCISLFKWIYLWRFFFFLIFFSRDVAGNVDHSHDYRVTKIMKY